MSVTAGYRADGMPDTRKRIAISLPAAELDQITAVAEADGRSPTSWATRAVRRALAAEKKKATLREVTSDEEDLLEAFYFFDNMTDGSAAAISDLLQLGLTSESVRNRIVALADELQSALAAPGRDGAKQPRKP